MERNQPIHKFRHEMITPLQRDATRVGWTVVEGRPIQAGEGFEMLQGALLIKNLGIALQGEGRIEDCLLYTSPSPRDQRGSRMPSSA